MLAWLADAQLDDQHLVYDPKYDGIRAIVEIGANGVVRLWSRLGNEKTKQFPEIAAALQRWARRRKEPLVLDGEIVALDDKGEPTGFQNLQGRIHLGGGGGREAIHARREGSGVGSSLSGRRGLRPAGNNKRPIPRGARQRRPDP